MSTDRENARCNLLNVLNAMHMTSNWADRAKLEEEYLNKLDVYFKAFLHEYVLELTVGSADKKDES